MTTTPTPLQRSFAPRLNLVLLAGLVLVAGIGVILFARHSGSSPSSSTSVEGSGNAATQTRALFPFTAIELAGSNNLAVRVGGTQSVAVHADDNLIELVTTDVRDGRLVIGNRGDFTTKSPMSIDVTLPTLAGATLTGSGTIVVAGVHGEQFVIRAPGSGVVQVSGTVGRLDASLAGSGQLQLRDLVAQDVTATVSGSGQIQMHAVRSLDASVTGVGSILYSGDPSKVTQDVSGTGAITKQ